MDDLLYILILILWCIVHSGLITPKASAYFQQKLGPQHRYFRLGYNLFAGVSFLMLIWYSRFIDDNTIIFRWEGLWVFLQTCLFGYALYFFVFGAKSYDLKYFLGIDIFFSDPPQTHQPDIFTTCGANQWVRHPWYSAAFVAIWLRDIDKIAFIQNIVLSIYIVIGTFLEEKKMVSRFGEKYTNYQKRVPMLFPLPKRRGEPS